MLAGPHRHRWRVATTPLLPFYPRWARRGETCIRTTLLATAAIGYNGAADLTFGIQNSGVTPTSVPDLAARAR